MLVRAKFPKFPDFFTNSKSLLADIERYAVHFLPTAKIELIKDDDDNMLLELAEECSADFIITGNTRDFTFPFYKQTKIVTPKEYWENYRPVI